MSKYTMTFDRVGFSELGDKMLNLDLLSNSGYEKITFDLSKLKDSEIEIINKIIKLLKDEKVTDISEMSHREDGWKKTKKFEQISFEYAMNLKLIK